MDFRRFRPAPDRHVLWSWRIKGTGGKCRLLWKLDEMSAEIWGMRRGLELERIEGTAQRLLASQRPGSRRL